MVKLSNTPVPRFELSTFPMIQSSFPYEILEAFQHFILFHSYKTYNSISSLLSYENFDITHIAQTLIVSTPILLLLYPIIIIITTRNLLLFSIYPLLLSLTPGQNLDNPLIIL